MGSGKSTLAEYLITQHGYTKLSFAESLKEIVNVLNKTNSSFRALLFAIQRYYINPLHWFKFFLILKEASTLVMEYPKARTRLQFVGNQVREKIDKNFWVNIAIKKMLKLKSIDPELRFVIDDCRYPNELNILKKHNFFDIRVWCSDETRLERLKRLYDISSMNDYRLYAESEVALDNYACSITISTDNNDEVFDDLKFAISFFSTVYIDLKITTRVKIN